jgi:hypothetical protein
MITQANLEQFTGTEKYHRHWTDMVYTDGIEYLAEKAGAYWLIDAIASYQRNEKIKTEPFQLWELRLTEKPKAVLTMRRDTNEPEIVSQEIKYTDFPLDEIKLYLIDGVLLLPSEY